MHRIIAAVLAAASLADTAGAQTAPPPGFPAATASPQAMGAFSLESALAAGGVPSATASSAASSSSGASSTSALPSVAAASASVDAATAARRVAGLRPNPEVQAQVENIAGTGAYKGLRSSETTVGVALPLELGGKRPARVALATARLTRAQVQTEIARADLRLRITQLYIEAAAAERRAEVLGEQASIANNAFRIASDRVQVGDVGPIEQQRADVLRINAQVAADSAARQAHANAFLPTYLARHNERFARPPRVALDAHRPLTPRDDVDAEMVWREERTVTKSLSIHFNKAIFILDPTPAARSLASKRVQICEYPDGRIEVRHNHRTLPYTVFDKMRQVNQAEIVDSKRLGAALAMAQAMQEVRPHHRKRNNNEPARSSGSFTIFAPSPQPDTAKVDRRRLCTPKLKRGPRLSNDELIARGLGEYVR